jgi:DNA-binding CsgD family transcriptional regulator
VVTIKLYEHALAHAARVLRESGATASQVRIGVQLALGKSRPAIADELGMRLSSVADLAKRLYQTLDVHNSAEFGTKIWLGEKPRKTRQFRPPGWPFAPSTAFLANDAAKRT